VFRVTADSNIYISAFQFAGNPLRLLLLAAERRIDLAVSDHIIEEVTRTLEQKFAWPKGRTDAARRSMNAIARRCSPRREISVIVDDPSDNRILECAVEAGSEYIVTGDKHLLRIARYEGIRIVTAAGMLLLIDHPAGA
jgi:putative PIN family toxin of toxin-antitoxin system